MDGFYQMPAGHVESDEHPSDAAIREAMEEVGVKIDPKDLEFVHASHRFNNIDDVGDYVDFLFRITKWEGEPSICEPDKCDDLIWVSYDELPENLIPSVRDILGCIQKGVPFSESVDKL